MLRSQLCQIGLGVHVQGVAGVVDVEPGDCFGTGLAPFAHAHGFGHEGLAQGGVEQQGVPGIALEAGG